MQDAAADRRLTVPPAAGQSAELAVLPDADPSLEELFDFMAEAELRFESLRLRIVDRRITARGEEVETHEVWLRHPGRAKMISSRGEPAERDFDVWVSDGERVQTYDARGNTATDRRVPHGPVGATATDLPSFARVYRPRTQLPPESLADTFVHPHGFCRNVLSTGSVRRRGTAAFPGGREVALLRCDHPRASHVLTDRPDHWLEVGVDTQTGMIVLLAEGVGEQLTRHAEATSVSFDEPIPDDAFTLHVSSDTRTIY
jgi:hypothetical protein